MYPTTILFDTVMYGDNYALGITKGEPAIFLTEQARNKSLEEDIIGKQIKPVFNVLGMIEDFTIVGSYDDSEWIFDGQRVVRKEVS